MSAPPDPTLLQFQLRALGLKEQSDQLADAAKQAAEQARAQVRRVKMQGQGAQAIAKHKQKQLEFQAKQREKMQKAREKEGQAQAKEAGQQAEEPILSAPQPINMQRPEQSMGGPGFEGLPGTLGRVGPQVSNFGQPGGPQPGPPGAGQGPQGPPPMAPMAPQVLQPGGMAQPQFPQPPPTLTTTRQETFPMRMQSGAVVPMGRTITTTVPNEMTAYQAGVLQLKLAQDRQKSNELYLDNVARMVRLAKRDPVSNEVASAEIMRIARTSPELLDAIEYRVGALSAKEREYGERHPTAIAAPGAPRGLFVTPQEAIGQRKPISGTEAGLGALAGALGGAMQLLTKETTNKLQDATLKSVGTIAGLLEMRRTYQPQFLTYKGRAQGWWNTQLGKVDPNLLDDQAKQDQYDFKQFQSGTAAFFRDYATSEAGKALTKIETQTIKPVTPNMDDSAVDYMAKWDRFMRANAMLIAQNTYFLRKGYLTPESIAGALVQEPQLIFNFDQPNKLQYTPGEREMLRRMSEQQTNIEMQLRQAASKTSAGPLDEGAIKKQARDATMDYYGIPPVLRPYLGVQ